MFESEGAESIRPGDQESADTDSGTARELHRRTLGKDGPPGLLQR